MNEFSKIFCLGLPRTATSSLAQALTEHGIQTIHFPFGLYEEGLEAPVVTEHTAFVDTPIPLLYKELDARWPDAKFILTLRDKESWLESMKWLREEGGKIWQRRPVYDEYNREFFGTTGFDADRLSEVYEAHHAEIRSYFSDREEDLLAIDVISSSDTQALVDFLKIDELPIPWPQTNEARKPTALQRLAYQFEKRHFMRAGTALRMVNNGLQRRFGNRP